MILRSIRIRAPLVIFLLLIAALFTLSSLITPAQIESITGSSGRYGLVLVGFIILLTQIFAPLSGTPVLIVGIRLYGYPATMAVLYLSFLFSAVINFWIARLYGRDLVRKFVGAKALTNIDELSQINETALLVSGRIFGYSFFDFVSYAVGLTSISFRKYYAYTLLLTPIPFFAQYFLFSTIDFRSFKGIVIYFFSIAAIGVVFARIFHKAHSKTQVAEVSKDRQARG